MVQRVSDVKDEQVTATLEGPDAVRVRAFVKATMSNKAALVRLALREFIASTIEKNASIRADFLKAQALELAPRVNHLRVVK